MAKVTGFLEHGRQPQPYRPIAERLEDWREMMKPWPAADLQTQASRCMDCGIPFCHEGCPLGNMIPDWNELVYLGQWREAINRLHATNNFPEFTGVLCPAPCEGSCVLGINDQPVTIRSVELAIIDHAWEQGWVQPLPAAEKTGRRVAIVGSGPAGLAAAQQLVRIGHAVTVFERDDRPGGLLRYGIPEFKMEKSRVQRRLEQLAAEGVEFATSVNVGQDLPVPDLRVDFDALLLANGSTAPRDLPVSNRHLAGIHQAMEYLPMQNRICEGDAMPDHFISAAGRDVIIIGGGDTGADCLGTVNRQGARSVRQLEIMPRPPVTRSEDNPWPQWPRIFRTAPAHEEGVERSYLISTRGFIDNGQGAVSALQVVDVRYEQDSGRFTEVEGSSRQLPCDLVLLALGFVGPEKEGLLQQLGVKLTPSGTVQTDAGGWMSSVDGVFAAGDARRGQSLIVWAIAEGRSAARAIDMFLSGQSRSVLSAPL